MEFNSCKSFGLVALQRSLAFIPHAILAVNAFQRAAVAQFGDSLINCDEQCGVLFSNTDSIISWREGSAGKAERGVGFGIIESDRQIEQNGVDAVCF